MERLPSIRVVLLTLVVAAVASAAALGPLVGDALLGFDAYPLIAASRIDGLADLAGTFREELMDGRYPDGRFYRPLVHLSFALDYELGGLEPVWYAATDVALCALAAWLIGLCAMQFAGPGGAPRAAAAVGAALLFILHRSQIDVVPYAPRRADALAILFVAATALAVLRRAHGLAVAALALCAFFSKESGVIALPVALAAAFARGDEGPRGALRAALAPAAALAIGIAVRTAVLGGLGGHAESDVAYVSGVDSRALGLWRALTRDVVGGAWVVVGLLIAIVSVVAVGTGRRVLTLAAVWILSALAITYAAERFHDWYALPLVPGIALVSGVAVGGAVRGNGAVDRLGGLAAATLVVCMAAASLGADQREALRVAQRISADQVERFTSLVAGESPGTDVTFEPWVLAVAMRAGAPPVFVHAPYSLSALGDLTLSRSPVVAVEAGRPTPSEPDAVVVRLVPGPPPADVVEAPR
ncbi:MAG: hypothetical protein AAF726_06720 [Planctomycetota bacterium]